MEADIIRRAQSGDQRAFQRLVEQHTHVVWHTAAALLRDRALAEDAAQEAWVDVWKALYTFQPDRPFRPWLLAVVANRCRMLLRRRSLTTISLDYEASTFVTDITDSHDTEALALQTEADAELRTMLASLTTEQRTILELHFFADLALAEIALVIDTPLGTVKSRLHRALHTLRSRAHSGSALVAPLEEPS
jgi:RNA polymerase sigma-70 factor, ECF subfamily